MKRKVFFRVDGNKITGRGHVSRCLALAEMLKHDFEIVFASFYTNKQYMTDLVCNFGIVFIHDNDELKSHVSKEDFLWLDGYDFSEAWKKEMRSFVFKLVETNDIPYEAKNVDVLINHTPGLKKSDFGTIDNTELLLGLDYALLRPDFLKLARQETEPEFINQGRGVFVCFGGADTYNLGEGFVKALETSSFTDPIYWVRSNSESGFKTSDQVQVLSNLSEKEMIKYMQLAKVVLIPSSVLSFEAMALRKPIFTCYFADNQKLINNGLERLKLGHNAGLINSSDRIQELIDDLLIYYDNPKRQKMHIKNQIENINGLSGFTIRENISNLSRN